MRGAGKAEILLSAPHSEAQCFGRRKNGRMGGEHLIVDWGLCWASKKEAILAGRQERAMILESE